MSSIAIIHDTTEDGNLAVIANVDAAEYDPAQEYMLELSILDPAASRAIHSGSTQFKQAEGASVCLEHAPFSGKRIERIEAAAAVYMRPDPQSKWAWKERAKKEYTLFYTDCLLPASLELHTEYGYDQDSGEPFVVLAASAVVAARPGYTLERFYEDTITLNYSISGGEPVSLTGVVEPSGIIKFKEQKLAYLAGAGSYFILSLECLVSQDGGLTLRVPHVTDSRKYG